MKNSKLIRLLRTFDKKEWKALNDYLIGSYSDHELPLRLFQYLKNFYPSFDDEKLEIEAVTIHLELDKKDRKRVSNEASKLTGWVEDFLLIKHLNKKHTSNIRQKLLIDIFADRQLGNLFFQEIEKAKKDLDKDLVTPFNLVRLLELNDQYYYNPLNNKYKLKQVGIPEALEQLNLFCSIMTQRYQCELESRAYILQIPEEERLNSVKSNKHAFVLLHQLYKDALRLIQDKEENCYFELKGKVMQYGVQFHSSDHFILLGYLINYTAQLIRKNPKKGLVESFNLYKYGIKKGLLIVGGYITEKRFHNIVNVACELNELKWLEDFLQTFQPELVKEWSDDTIKLAEARIAFEKGNFEQVLQILRKIDLIDYAFKLQAKILQIRCYFELSDKYWEELHKGIRAFEVLLTRNKVLSIEILESCHNFLEIINDLIESTCTKQELEEKIQNKENVIAKTWLEKKIKSYSPIYRK